MQAVNSFVLGEIVNTQVLQEIQDKFSEATGFGAVIIDREGNPITRPLKKFYYTKIYALC